MAEVSEKFAEILKKLEEKKSLDIGERMDFPDFIKKEGIPNGFKGWDTKINAVSSVAHEFARIAATSGGSYLRFGGERPEKIEYPKDFDKWLLRDRDGATVFELAEKAEILPPEMTKHAEGADSDQEQYFSRKDVGGKVLAHGLAEAGLLPIAPSGWKGFGVGFRCWDLRDDSGRTVAEVAKAHPKLGRIYGERIALWEAGKLQEGFDQWDKKTIDGDMIAHCAARVGMLPKTFDRWDLEHNGMSVKDVFKERIRSSVDDASSVSFTSFPDNMPDDLLNTPLGGKFKGGATVAHAAAVCGAKIPFDYPGWGDKISAQYMKNLDLYSDWARKNETVAHCAARSGALPPGFDKWEIRGANGDSVAERAAEFGKLPEQFDKWVMVDHKGNTIAHLAVLAPRLFDDGEELLDIKITLPSSLNDWHVKNAEGKNVIELARENAPKEIAGYVEEAYARAIANEMAKSIADSSRERVASSVCCDAPTPELSYKEAAQALRDGTLPADFNDWGKKNSDGWTLAHAAAALGKLPPDFNDWSTEGAKPGITVAHIAMRYSELPASFDDWGIKDASGKTLGEVAVKHPKLGAEYQARIEASKQAQQPKLEAGHPEPQAAKPSSEAQAQGGKNNQAAPIETSSTGRITGGGRFSRPPDLSNREPEPERRPIKAFISRGM